jgi:hypothetical protein
MSNKLTPEILSTDDNFELIEEISHNKLREFIVRQVLSHRHLIRSYAIYQVTMLMLQVFLLIKAIILWNRALPEALINIGLAVVFSFSLLVILHETFHAAAYYLTGARRLHFGAIWKKFVFYVMADRQVISHRSFRIVAYTPLLLVKFLCLAGAFIFRSEPQLYFFLTVMCLHSMFCGGDMAMLAFYRLYPDREIYNFDDRKVGKTYFFARKTQNPV